MQKGDLKKVLNKNPVNHTKDERFTDSSSLHPTLFTILLQHLPLITSENPQTLHIHILDQLLIK